MKDLFERSRNAAPPGNRIWCLWKLVPYCAITLSGMLVTFFLIDRVNKPIGFMTNEFHKVITFLLALLSVILSIRTIAAQASRSEETIDSACADTASSRRCPWAGKNRADRKNVRPGTDRFHSCRRNSNPLKLSYARSPYRPPIEREESTVPVRNSRPRIGRRSTMVIWMSL